MGLIAVSFVLWEEGWLIKGRKNGGGEKKIK